MPELSLTNLLISEIVDTYDLNDRVKEIVAFRAQRRTKEMFLDNFEDIYQYISFLNDSMSVPFRERTSLDSKNHTDWSLLEGLSREDACQTEDIRKSIPTDDILTILGTHLDSAELKVLEFLLIQQDSLRIPYEELLKNVKKVKQRLSQVVKKYWTKGSLQIPARTIVSVSFPLKLKFQRRSYEGNPLALFEAHKKRYCNKSRNELAEFDQGLYQALLNSGQIDQAIPSDKRFLPERQREEIITALKSNGGNVPLIARQIGESKSTVRHIAKKEKLYVLCIASTLEERTRIVAAYEQFNGNANETVRQLHVGSKKIRQYWREAGLEISPVNKLTKKNIEEIIEAHDTYNGNQSEAAKHLPHSNHTFNKYWKEAGLMTDKQLRKPVTEEEIQRIVGAYTVYTGNATRTAKELGYSTFTILKYWRQSGLAISPAGIKNQTLTKKVHT